MLILDRIRAYLKVNTQFYRKLSRNLMSCSGGTLILDVISMLSIK